MLEIANKNRFTGMLHKLAFVAIAGLSLAGVASAQPRGYRG